MWCWWLDLAHASGPVGQAVEDEATIVNRLVSLVGIAAMVGIAYLRSERRKDVAWRPVLWAVGIQLLLGLVILSPAVSGLFYEVVDGGVKQLLSFAEDGATFVENALIKARAVSAATDLPSIADDSGLVVSALGGAPGIFSARYAGETATDADNNARLLRELAPHADRRAFFFCCMVFLRSAQDPTPLIATGQWHGEILTEPRGSGGFGYDPLFWVADLKKSAAELVKADKNTISHRGQACALMLQSLNNSRMHLAHTTFGKVERKTDFFHC